MHPVEDVQHWLRSSALAGLIIPSTDEFISEWTPPPNRRLRWVTGFRGSMGTAVVLRDTAALFLDGRYLLQGAEDVGDAAISIEPAALPSRRTWLKRSLSRGARLGIDPAIHSIMDMTQWRGLARELGFELQMLAENPIDSLRPDGGARHRPRIVDYPIQYAGETYQSKCAELADYLLRADLQALLVADAEDVSWLLNVRAAQEVLKTEVGDLNIVPSCASRALVHRDGRVSWFVEKERLAAEVMARGESAVTIFPPDRLPAQLREAAQNGPIGADPRRTPAALEAIVSKEGQMVADDAAARRRWRKNAVEVRGAKRAHIVDAVAVVRFMAWLTRTVLERTVSEFEAAEKLEALRGENPQYKGPSMPLMSASGPNGAQPHYVPRRGNCRSLNDHPVYWMDSGGQYFGGTTDNTLTLAIGTPEPRHVRAHTLVLKGYIALAMTRFPVRSVGLHLDPIARQALWSEGMDYAHNTGHGVGSYLNIHEGPGIGREPGPTSTVPIEAGVIVSNEPGYYVDGDFGLRIESHMVTVASRQPGFLEFETISRLPIDPRLVDFERLSTIERGWLADYHGTVLKDIESLLDPASVNWLRALVAAYAQIARQ